jgi:hypothetical protein
MDELNITLSSDIIKANLAQQLGEYTPTQAIKLTTKELEKAIKGEGLQVYTKAGLEKLKSDAQNEIQKADEGQLVGELEEFFKGLVHVEITDREGDKDVWVKKANVESENL